MPVEVIMPKLGLTMAEGTIARWLKRVGDRVEPGEPLFEVQTDKVTMEVEAEVGGVLHQILVPEGEMVPVTRTVAFIATPDEAPSRPLPKATPVAERMAREHGVDLGRLQGTGPRGQITARDVRRALEAQREPRRPLVRASWRARRLAREHGINLAELAPGRGPEGRIVEKDVLEALAAREAAPAGEWLELTPVQRVAAERMAQSFSTVPHFYLTVEAQAEHLLDLRERLLPMVEGRTGVRLTLSDILIKIVAMALREHPRANGVWEEGRVRLNREVNVGLATATKEGLIVPVIRQADRKSLSEIAAERASLTAKAQEGRLTLDEISGATFTLTNLGMYGVDQFHAIINPPQSAILAVGRVKERPVGVDGQLTLKPTVFLTFSCDHRALDGAVAAAFLQRVVELIEEPYALLA